MFIRTPKNTIINADKIEFIQLFELFNHKEYRLNASIGESDVWLLDSTDKERLQALQKKLVFAMIDNNDTIFDIEQEY